MTKRFNKSKISRKKLKIKKIGSRKKKRIYSKLKKNKKSKHIKLLKGGTSIGTKPTSTSQISPNLNIKIWECAKKNYDNFKKYYNDDPDDDNNFFLYTNGKQKEFKLEKLMDVYQFKIHDLYTEILIINNKFILTLFYEPTIEFNHIVQFEDFKKEKKNFKPYETMFYILYIVDKLKLDIEVKEIQGGVYKELLDFENKYLNKLKTKPEEYEKQIPEQTKNIQNLEAKIEAENLGEQGKYYTKFGFKHVGDRKHVRKPCNKQESIEAELYKNITNEATLIGNVSEYMDMNSGETKIQDSCYITPSGMTKALLKQKKGTGSKLTMSHTSTRKETFKTF